MLRNVSACLTETVKPEPVTCSSMQIPRDRWDVRRGGRKQEEKGWSFTILSKMAAGHFPFFSVL